MILPLVLVFHIEQSKDEVREVTNDPNLKTEGKAEKKTGIVPQRMAMLKKPSQS